VSNKLEDQLRGLWLRAQSGDDAAYREALAMAATRLRGYFLRRMRSLPDDVEDLVQETLLTIHLQRDTYDPGRPLTAWLHAIARHKHIDFLRRHGRTAALHDPIDEGHEDLLPAVEQEFTARRDLGTLLARLPAEQRQAILDTKIEGLSVTEAAARSGATESAVKVRVHRGLRRLAAWLRSDE
jgi:RNA polymerase sigma-70 factor, ECF subfamily